MTRKRLSKTGWLALALAYSTLWLVAFTLASCDNDGGGYGPGFYNNQGAWVSGHDKGKPGSHGCPISEPTQTPTPDPVPTPAPNPEGSPTPTPTTNPDPRSQGEIDCENQGKSWVCHFPKGDVENYFNICIGNPAVAAHLEHGDALGECPDKQ